MNQQQIQSVVLQALPSMKNVGPKPLAAQLSKFMDWESSNRDGEIKTICELMISGPPNEAPRLRFSGLLREWDNLPSGIWNTDRNTAERRQLIYKLLELDPAQQESCDENITPYLNLGSGTLIQAENHKEWYKPSDLLRTYYWDAYCNYLEQQKNWPKTSTLSLDTSTADVIGSLSDPQQKEAYQSKGLVMGYVQSGKTAHFTGLIAKAADAGYRLFIVLAGTWNILRDQTQKRLDKELVGKELLEGDEDYIEQKPGDWQEFLEHEHKPSERGFFDWRRLTSREYDYRSLKAGIDSLEFDRIKQDRPLYHPDNLHRLPARLIVIKKHTTIINKLIKDLKRLKNTEIADLPTLIIDDESDQASINTRMAVGAASGNDRSKTNARIVELLGLFPRGQYVGYTATPYANVLINPDDDDDLFPKDFIYSLDKPEGYMGVADFFDLDEDLDEEDLKTFVSRKKAFTREVRNKDEDPKNLPRALASFVLAGAMKLYRMETKPKEFDFTHHTMLIHTSSRTAHHGNIATLVRKIYDEGGFSTPAGQKTFQTLWEEDFREVTKAQEPDLPSPKSFKELERFIGPCLDRIEEGDKKVLVINGETADVPRFDDGPVWKILVGGNKLSRGFTVEGLTISYYRRDVKIADTLMQMGRWFGFRKGYRDLIRLFIGTEEPRNRGRQVGNLLDSYLEICHLEEDFRSQLEKYAKRPDGQRITPKQVPPLMAVIGDLPPTAANKMHNAILTSVNFGGKYKESTLAPRKNELILNNQEAVRELFRHASMSTSKNLGGKFRDKKGDIKTWEPEALVAEVDNGAMTHFLKSYRWLNDQRREASQYQIEFLENEKHGIQSWQVLGFQLQKSHGPAFGLNGAHLNVRSRARLVSGSFKVYSEPKERNIAKFLCGFDASKLMDPSETTKQLKHSSKGVMLLYAVRAKSDPIECPPNIGYALLWPKNDLPFLHQWTTRQHQ